MFEQMKTDPEFAKLFDIGMTGLHLIKNPDAILKAFDWSSLKEGAEVIDVGGGSGSLAMGILKIRPSLHCVTQDLAHVVKRGQQWFGERMPSALETGNMKFEAQDFFNGQPASRISSPPDIYILRSVTHNWPDSEVVAMLRNLRNACGPNTKLLLIDQVLTYACRSSGDGQVIPKTNKSIVPSPLLGNLGQTHRHGNDINMMMLLDAQERTLEEFCKLFDASGWKLNNMYQSNGGTQTALIVAEPN